MSKQVKYGDVGTKVRHDRKELTSTMVEGQPRTQVKKKPPIEEYYDKNEIDASQRAAGEAMYRYFTNGYVGQNNCEYREPVQGGGQSTMTERQVAAQQQWKRGITAINSYAAFKLIQAVCIDEKCLSKIYPNNLWRRRKKAKALLHSTLTDIAKEYGYC